jgi:hypothetical protein
MKRRNMMTERHAKIVGPSTKWSLNTNDGNAGPKPERSTAILELIAGGLTAIHEDTSDSPDPDRNRDR